jgi:CBS domain-containing protein
MIFELTQNTAVLLPMMAVSVLAVLAARTLERDSIYVESLRSAGIVWEKTPEATAASSLKVADIMRRDIQLVPQSVPLASVLDTFLTTRSLTLYVGDAEGRLKGAVDIHAVKEMLAERDLATMATAAELVAEVPFVTPDEPLTSVNEKLWFRDLGQLPVVDSVAGGRFLGVVTRRDLLGAFDREILQRDRLVARFRATGTGGRVDYFDLPESYRLAEVEVPADMEGVTVAELDLRARFGVSVLAVKRLARGGIERRFVPGPEDRMERGDVLIVLAQDEAIARLKAGQAGAVLS